MRRGLLRRYRGIGWVLSSASSRQALLLALLSFSPSIAGGAGVSVVDGGHKRRGRVAAGDGQAVEVVGELLVGDGPLVGGVESESKGPAEADGGEGDVSRCVLGADCAITGGGLDEPVKDAASGVALIGPIVVVEERVHDVDGTESTVDGGVQIPMQRLATGGSLLESGPTLPDRTVQDLDGRGSQKLLLIREVSVQRGDPHPGTISHGIPRWFATDLENELDRRIDDRLTVASGVSAHRTTPRIESFRRPRNGLYSSTSYLMAHLEDSWPTSNNRHT